MSIKSELSSIYYAIRVEVFAIKSLSQDKLELARSSRGGFLDFVITVPRATMSATMQFVSTIISLNLASIIGKEIWKHTHEQHLQQQHDDGCAR